MSVMPGLLIGLAVVVAAAAAAALIPLVMPLLQRYALARPNARSSHRIPTPQGGGGPVVAVAIAVTLLAAPAAQFSGAAAQYYLVVLAGAAIMAVIGAVDDIRPLPPKLRLVLQFVLAAGVVFCAPADWRIAPVLPVGIERMLAVVAGVWFVNLTNFMDGIDWMTVTEGVPVTAALAAFAAFGALSLPGGLLAAALCGGLIGFAFYNRHPATLFLGDVGSLPIGLIMAAGLFELAARVSLAAAVILPLYFVFDATQTLFRRWRAGENLMVAHRRHAYQNAVDSGWSVSAVNQSVIVLNLGLTALAVLAAFGPDWIAAAALVVAFWLTARLCRSFRKAAA